MSKEKELKALIKKASEFAKKNELEHEQMLLMLDEVEATMYDLKAHPSYPDGVVELRDALENEEF